MLYQLPCVAFSLSVPLSLFYQGSQQRSGAVELASLTRRLFAYLYQLGQGAGEEEEGEGGEEINPAQQDTILIPV